jgi:PAS domain S-box-containing protein
MITERPAVTLDAIYQEVANVIPPGWQYPDITCARITIDGKEFKTPNYRETAWKQASDIIVDSQRIGAVEVFYLEEKPEYAEGPFLKEERNLIDGIARQLAGFIQHRQAEEALRESETTLSTIIDVASEGIILHDDAQRIIRFNQAAQNVFGYRADEVIGKPLDILLPARFVEYHHSCIQDFASSPVTRRLMSERTELPGRRKDGTEFPSQVSISKIEVEGRKIFMAILRDITEQKRAEEELARLASFPELNPDPVIETDPNGVVTYLNPAGRKEFPELLTAVEKHPILTSLKPTLAALQSKKKKSLVIEVEVGNRIYEQRVSCIPACERLRSYIRDITERKKMEERLIETDRLASIGELAAGIAHELNNPLTSVIGFSQLLMEKDVADDVREDIKVIYGEAQRTAQVVKGLLTFARKHAPVKQLVNINSIIEKVLELRAYQQRLSNIQVNTRFAPDLPEIMADYFQLQQVFLNIIINAEHFMIEAHNRGTLTITTERIRDIIRASFADDGPGISKETLGHLFDPFFTTKEVGKGTGLGLSICHGIITEHGGRIYAKSKSSKGATFVVELPITIAREGAAK